MNERLQFEQRSGGRWQGEREIRWMKSSAGFVDPVTRRLSDLSTCQCPALGTLNLTSENSQNDDKRLRRKQMKIDKI